MTRNKLHFKIYSYLKCNNGNPLTVLNPNEPSLGEHLIMRIDFQFQRGVGAAAAMSKQSTFTVALATMLGATLGGLFLWRSIRTQKRKALKDPASAEPVQAQLEADVTASQPARQEPQTQKLLRVHSLLEVPPVIVSSPEEWETLWPGFQKELSVYPVLGLDCEWVKSMRVSMALCVA